MSNADLRQQAPEKPFPRFDAHVHIWSDDRTAYPQVPGKERPVEMGGSVEQLLGYMDEHDISGALLVQTPWYGEDNRYFVDAMHRFPGRFAALGYLPDPLAPDAPEKLRYQYAEESFRGIRLHLLDDRITDSVAGGKADPLVRQAVELGVPIQFLIREPDRHAVVQNLAQRFPDGVFIIDHLGHPPPGEGYPFPSSRAFFACGEMPNIYAKVSLHYMHSTQDYPWSDLHDYQHLTLETYGPQRLMWGSNYPMELPDPPYRERLAAVSEELPFLTADERSWILGRTALSLWTPVNKGG